MQMVLICTGSILTFWEHFVHSLYNNLLLLYFCLLWSFVFREKTEFYKRRERHVIYLFTSSLGILGYCHTQIYLNNSIIKSHHVIDLSTNICSKIISLCVSYFTSVYVMKWKDFFPNKDLREPPYFDGRVVCYPNMKTIHDYLACRLGDCKLLKRQSTFLLCM